MALCMILVLIVMLFSIRIHNKGLDPMYLSKDYTAAIKGIFIMFVFISHSRSYFEITSTMDNVTIQFMNYVGQLMVTLFLFYSGYGVYEAIKSKKLKYINRMPYDRILKTFFDFALAILLFYLLGTYLNKKYTLTRILLALTGLVSIGNSNWYMFVIFTLYIFTYLCFKLLHKKPIYAIIALTIISLGYIYVIRLYQPDRFCNTYLCYVLGMWYSYYKHKIDDFLQKPVIYYLSMIILVGCFILLYPYCYDRIMNYNLLSMFFCLIVVGCSMKIHFKSKILMYLGNMLFWIYILQRIPMTLIQHFQISNNTSIQVMLSLFVTIIFAIVMNCISKKLKQYIFK